MRVALFSLIAILAVIPLSAWKLWPSKSSGFLVWFAAVMAFWYGVRNPMYESLPELGTNGVAVYQVEQSTIDNGAITSGEVTSILLHISEVYGWLLVTAYCVITFGAIKWYKSRV